MSSSTAVQLDVQLDVNDIEVDVTAVNSFKEWLERIADGASGAFNEALNPDVGGLDNLQTSLGNIADDLDTVANKIEELVVLMAPQEENWFSSLVGGVDTFNTLADGREKMEGITEALVDGAKYVDENGGTFNIFKALIPNTLQSFQNLSKGISGAFSGINLAMNGSALVWGVVVAAIIAAIVLLIANWDTVKAAVLTAWETIKGALATAAEWFNTYVIQPVVGFFTGAMDWISTKIQEGFAFVQNIFAGVNEFLQGVFAKDWTEQFGAFGNVLNAFFANVENVWNAVCFLKFC